MHIAKILAGAAIVAAPFSHVSGQSATPADSGSQGSRAAWLAGSAAAVGTGLFLAFTHSGQGAVAAPGTTDFHAFSTSPSGPTVGGSTPRSSPNNPPQTNPPPNNPPPPNTTTSTTPPPDNQPPMVGADSPPSSDGPNAPTNDGPFVPTTNDGPPQSYAPSFTQESSTVPEPGTLALTATGIIGLVPLFRRRRR
ncbi:MAG: PEP-CTERM sorting domain-containing protein [Gemmatimonadaceae bacterium]